MSLSLESSFLTRTIIAKVSGLLSMVRSGLIIHDVVSRWRRRKDREALPTVSRVILSMSLADLGSSFIAHFIGTWMVPSGIVDDSFQIPLAAGNEATCIAQAFISSVFILSGASSNGSLALAYWLTICHGKREHELKKWNWQLFLVYLPWIWGVMDGSIGVALGFHNYNRLWYCDTLTASNPSKTHWRPDTAAAFLGIVNLLIVLSMFALIKFVHSVEKKTDSHRRINDPRSEREKRQTIQVTQQGIWFILAYMAAWWPAIIALIMYEKTPPEYVCFISAMYPLQGAFNALVYFRPKYIAERQRMISTSDSRVSRLSVVLDTMNLPRMSSENLSGILPKTPTKRGRHQEDPPLERNEHDVNDDVDIENGGAARSEKDKLKTLPRIDENS